MDPSITDRLEQLSLKIIEVTDRVGKVVDAEVKLPPDVRAANEAVQKVVADYNKLVNQVDKQERREIERNVGRRITDLRRFAARLPKIQHVENPVPLAENNFFGGWMPPPPPPKEEDADQLLDAIARAPRRERDDYDPNALRVGGDVEAWCGPCDGLREHTIVAMVNGEPKQLLCQSCGAKHGYRTGPARKRTPKGTDNGTKAKRKVETPKSAAARRKEEERFALQKELTEATDVPEFNPRARYHQGDIIDHPEFGRGKVENVLKGSLLVRFRTGLKSVNTR